MIQIDSANHILLTNQLGVLERTTLGLAQRRDQTVVYTREEAGRRYAEHTMPRARYSTAHDAPVRRDGTPTGAAGRTQLEADVRALLSRLANE